MAFSPRSAGLRLGVALLFAIAMSLVGFGHAWPALGKADLADYALPDGTLPTLCLAQTDQAPDQPKLGAALCDACLLKVGLKLQHADGAVIGRVQPALRIRQAGPFDTPRSACRPDNHQARAPPSPTP